MDELRAEVAELRIIQLENRSTASGPEFVGQDPGEDAVHQNYMVAQMRRDEEDQAILNRRALMHRYFSIFVKAGSRPGYSEEQILMESLALSPGELEKAFDGYLTSGDSLLLDLPIHVRTGKGRLRIQSKAYRRSLLNDILSTFLKAAHRPGCGEESLFNEPLGFEGRELRDRYDRYAFDRGFLWGPDSPPNEKHLRAARGLAEMQVKLDRLRRRNKKP